MRLRRESRNRPERYRGRRGDSSPRTDRVSQWRIRFTIARMPGTRGRRRDRRRQGLARGCRGQAEAQVKLPTAFTVLFAQARRLPAAIS
jgi:hypothetical protein